MLPMEKFLRTNRRTNGRAKNYQPPDLSMQGYEKKKKHFDNTILYFVTRCFNSIRLLNLICTVFISYRYQLTRCPRKGIPGTVGPIISCTKNKLLLYTMHVLSYVMIYREFSQSSEKRATSDQLVRTADLLSKKK